MEKESAPQQQEVDYSASDRSMEFSDGWVPSLGSDSDEEGSPKDSGGDKASGPSSDFGEISRPMETEAQRSSQSNKAM